MEDLLKLLKTGQNLKIEISAEDLRTFGQEIAAKSIEGLEKHLKKESDAQYLTGNKVCELLAISRVTLWEWDKKGITKPIRLGNLKRYLRSDIENLGQQKIDNSK